ATGEPPPTGPTTPSSTRRRSPWKAGAFPSRRARASTPGSACASPPPPTPDARAISDAIDLLLSLRTEGDYRLRTAGRFTSGTDATAAVAEGRRAVHRLDAVEADPARRAALTVAVRA